MPRFQILPTDQSASIVFDAPHAGEVLNRAYRLRCKDADVLRDNEYVFSLRLDGSGLWCVYQRDIGGDGNVVALFD